MGENTNVSGVSNATTNSANATRSTQAPATATGKGEGAIPKDGAAVPGNTGSEANGKDAQAPLPETKKFKVKINGAEQELDESEIVRLAQLGKSAYKKFEEAAAERKKVESFKNGLKSNFVDTLKKMAPELGLDPSQVRQMVEDYLVDQIKLEQMTPDQRKNYNIEQELKSLKEKEHYRNQEEEARQAMTLQERYSKEYDIKFTEALKGMNIPKTPFTVSRMATYMTQAIENGYDLDPLDAAKLVHEDYKNDIKSTFEGMSGEQILALIGDQSAQKIRQYDVSKIQNRYVKSNQNTQTNQTKEPSKDKSWADWHARLDKIEKGDIAL